MEVIASRMQKFARREQGKKITEFAVFREKRS
jgi:hypothetical protein